MDAGRRERAARGRWLDGFRWPRGPHMRRVALYAVLLLALALADGVCQSAATPVEISRDGAGVTVRVGGVTRHIATRARLLAITLAPQDPVAHEYQIDGTDSTNNFTLDAAYLHSISATPYYRFYAWMRGQDSLSHWRDLCATADGQPARCVASPPFSGASLVIPDGVRQRASVALQQPETPETLDVTLSGDAVLAITIDRNDHVVVIAQDDPLHPAIAPITAFYPNDPGDIWPVAAMTLDLLIRTLLWALAALGAIWIAEALLGWVGLHLPPSRLPRWRASRVERAVEQRATPGFRPIARLRRILAQGWASLTRAIHPVGLALIGASFAGAIWIALVQYHAQPHIYDASAYLFGARIFASGRLYAPAPAAPDQFPGPFMAVFNGRWFTQYEPGTSATLALGVALGVPWLVEPLLGALALLGMGLTLRRLYDRKVATLAVALGAISPFYLWIAASYLSHAIALFYLIWGLWALTRFGQGGRGWNLPFAAACWALGMLTRDITALFVVASVAGLAWVAWRERWPVLWRERWVAPIAWTGAVIAAYLAIYLGYNAILTGRPLLTARVLMYPREHWGFGPGVGFYGQHTLAAGFITVHELLTSLSITLFGWPFYLTLAFIPVPFLARRARPADVFLLGAALLLTFGFLGFFYHGIYLGPRVLFEALPFLLGLTVRGLLTLAEVGQSGRRWGLDLAARLIPPLTKRRAGWGVAAPGLAAPALFVALLACAALYYFPRQIALHTDFTGMGAGTVLKTAMLSHPPVHHAIIITADRLLYGYTLAGLNDPALRGDALYAYATGVSDYADLRRAYPDRRFYLLTFDTHGQPRFTPLGA